MKTVTTISKADWDALRYPVMMRELDEEEGGGWIAWIPLLGQGLFARDGDTPEEALRLLEEHRRHCYDLVIESGAPIPIPSDEEEARSGKWLQRSSPRLHAELQAGAEREGTSFNAYCNACLERGHAARSVAHEAAQAVREEMGKLKDEMRDELREKICQAVREEVGIVVTRFTIETTPRQRPATLYAYNNATPLKKAA